jgi:hypothetical protein
MDCCSSVVRRPISGTSYTWVPHGAWCLAVYAVSLIKQLLDNHTLGHTVDDLASKLSMPACH